MQPLNTPIPPKAIPVARESLALSDAMHGLQGMTPPNTGMYNSDDGGAMSKPYLNANVSENQELARQNMIVNAQTAAPQAAAGAMGAVRKGVTEQSTQEFRAQEFLNEKMATQLDAAGLGQNLMQINAIMGSDPDRAKFVNDVETSRAMFSGQAPELGAERAQEQYYRRA